MTNTDLKIAAEFSFLVYAKEHIVSFDNDFTIKKTIEKPLTGLSNVTPDKNKIKVMIGENRDTVVIAFRGANT